MLHAIAQKPVRRVVGLMSGTSVDGIDAALIELAGREELRVRLLAFENKPYNKETRNALFELFNPLAATVDKVGRMNFLLGELFAEAAQSVIKKAGLSSSGVDLIGSHGQTVYHGPVPVPFCGRSVACTVQIGEGAVIADRTGIPCVSDFRVADMAAGGQGAPLVPFTEYLLYRDPARNILLLNLGGIGNITAIPAACEPNEIFAFDTGPGNMMIDALVSRLTDGRLTMDTGGALAGRGRIRQDLLSLITGDPYFLLPPPKSTGRELFGSDYVERLLNYMTNKGISLEDGAATLTYATAWSVKDAYLRFIHKRIKASRLIIGGGGSYNPVLVNYLRREFESLGVETLTQEDLGHNSDAKEAVAFAVLADCTAAGKTNSLPSVTGAARPVVMGKISLPL